MNTTEVVDVVANYSNANIPLETQWVDIDYMDAYLDFTLDPTNFQEKDMTALVNSLHANDQYFVPIVDPGIYVANPTYSAFVKGMEQNVFVKDMNGVDPYLGQVWPGPTYFPDWFAENTTSWWSYEMAEFHDLLAYDGIWIDMVSEQEQKEQVYVVIITFFFSLFSYKYYTVLLCVRMKLLISAISMAEIKCAL